jgi:hypothetical protein
LDELIPMLLEAGEKIKQTWNRLVFVFAPEQQPYRCSLTDKDARDFGGSMRISRAAVSSGRLPER